MTWFKWNPIIINSKSIEVARTQTFPREVCKGGYYRTDRTIIQLVNCTDADFIPCAYYHNWNIRMYKLFLTSLRSFLFLTNSLPRYLNYKFVQWYMTDTELWRQNVIRTKNYRRAAGECTTDVPIIFSRLLWSEQTNRNGESTCFI